MILFLSKRPCFWNCHFQSVITIGYPLTSFIFIVFKPNFTIVYPLLLIFSRIWPRKQCDYDMFFVKKEHFFNFFSAKVTRVYSLIFSFSYQIYDGICPHFIEFPQHMAVRKLWHWHYFSQERPFFCNSVVFEPEFQRWICLFLNLSFSS